MYRIRTYTKKELAAAYAPGMTRQAAQRQLERWLHGNPQLMERLSAAGYKPRQRLLSPALVRIIFSVLGPP